MAKKHEVKQSLAKAADEIKVSAEKTDAEGFDQDVHDALVAKFDELTKQLVRLENAEKVASTLVSAVPGQDRTATAAPLSAHKLFSTIKNFKDHTKADGTIVRAADQAYAAGMWVKATMLGNAAAAEWCKINGVPVQKAQGENVDSAGGFLVPEELMATIIVLRESFGVFRQECQVVPMGSDTLNWPRRTGGLTAFFTGENTSVQESQASWDNVNLTAKKIGVLTRMSNEIDEDAVIAIGDWLVGEIAYAFASKEDDCGFNGDGTSTFGGMRGLTQLAIDGAHNASKYTAASGHNTFATITIADLTGLMGTLPQYAITGAKWYMSQQGFYQMIANIAAAAGGNRLDVFPNPVAPRFLGFPVVFAQKLPIIATTQTGKAMAFFGDLSKAAMLGERRGVTMKRSDHRYFENDQIGLLGTERFDVNVHDMGDNTNAGPLVALVAP